MKTSITRLTLFLFLLFLISNVTLSQSQSITVNGTQIQVSPRLHKVLKQVETEYIKPSLSFTNLCNDAPDMASTLIGLIMQRQELYLKQYKNPDRYDNTRAIEKEISSFLTLLAKAHNNINPENGKRMTGVYLRYNFQLALRGDKNNYFIKKFGIDPTKVEIAYMMDKMPNARQNPEPAIDPYGKLILKKDKEEGNSNEIKLLDVAVIGGAKPKQETAVASNSGVKGLFKVKDQICPDRGRGSLIIDTNGNPDDKTYTTCKYFENGLLKYQYSYVKGKSHGVSLAFRLSKSGKRYLEGIGQSEYGEIHGKYLTNHEYPYSDYKLGKQYDNTYVNGKQHGMSLQWYMTDSGISYIMHEEKWVNGDRRIWKSYTASNKTGKRYLTSIYYMNNQEFLETKTFATIENGYNYVSTLSKYNYGKLRETVHYHSSGGTKAIAYYENGKYKDSKCWYKNGKQIKKEDSAYIHKSDDFCISGIDWMQTDWCNDKKTCRLMRFDLGM